MSEPLLRPGELVIGEVLGHHPWGMDLKLLPPAPDVVAVVDVMQVTDELPFGPPTDYPPIGARLEAVVLGYMPDGELRVSTRDSYIADRQPENGEPIEALRGRLAAASAPPWTVISVPGAEAFISTGRNDGKRLFIRLDLEPAAEADLTFIATARNELPRLADVLSAGSARDVTDDELRRWEAMLDQATGGPWRAHLSSVQPIGGPSIIWAGDDAYGPDMYVLLEDDIAPDADIDFIANARSDIPEMLSMLKYRRRRGEGT